MLYGAVKIKHNLHPFMRRLRVQGWLCVVAQGRPASLWGVPRTNPKALVNTAKHFAFNQCAEGNLGGMVDAETRVLEAELFAGRAFIL